MTAEQISSYPFPVLIVDNEPDISLALEDLLRYEGYVVRSVMTGRGALYEAEQSPFGAVILDLGLPDLSGFAVLRGLEDLDPLLPVIVLTASAQDSHTVESLRRGAFAYITKPYNRDELKIILRQALEVRKLVLKMNCAEHALSASEAQLRQQQIGQQVLLDIIPAMVWYEDTHNRILRANRHAAESINKTVAEVEGQSTYDIYPEEAEKYYKDDLAVIASGQPKLGIVERYEISPGQKRWVQTDKVPYRDAQGNVIGVLGFAQDITERKQAEAALQESERQYRLLMEEASDGIVVLDLDGHFRMANSKACTMFGYTKEELLQLHVKDTYVPAEKERAQQRLDQIRVGESVRFIRLMLRKDGTVIPVEVSETKMSDNHYLAIIRECP
jgi:PAS domain S-box-containing protein